MQSHITSAFVLVLVLGLTNVNGQGGYGGGDFDQGPAQQQQWQQRAGAAQQQISSLPQYEGEGSSLGTPQKAYPTRTQSKSLPPPSASQPGKLIPTRAKKPSRKDLKYRPIVDPNMPKDSGTSESKSKDPELSEDIPRSNDLGDTDTDCMLRIKSDCHAGAGGGGYSGDNVQQNDVPFEEPTANYLPPFPEPRPQSQSWPASPYYYQSHSPIPSFSNQLYSNHFGSIGGSYNQQQQYNNQPQQQPQSSQANVNGQQGHQNNQVQNYDEQPPYPGCPAAMICVPDDWCNATGYSEGRPLGLTPSAKAFRVAVMACTNVENNEIGICCRDPDFQSGAGGDGGDQQGQYQEPKPQGQGQGQYKPPQQQQQYQPPQQQQYPPPPQAAPQSPPQQSAPAPYSAGQSYNRPQAPQQQQQQPSYGGYQPQPQSQQQQQQQRQPQPQSPYGQSNQFQQPQRSPSPSGQGYQPQPQPHRQPSQQQPSYGGQPQAQGQQQPSSGYGAQPQRGPQPTYGAQPYSQGRQPQQNNLQKSPQASYGSAGGHSQAQPNSNNPYAGKRVVQVFVVIPKGKNSPKTANGSPNVNAGSNNAGGPDPSSPCSKSKSS